MISALVPAGSYAIDAKGGQGGDGANGNGGAFVGESSVPSDAKHIGLNNGVDNPWEFVSQACLAYTQSLSSTFVVAPVPDAVPDDARGAVSPITLPTGSATMNARASPETVHRA